METEVHLNQTVSYILLRDSLPVFIFEVMRDRSIRRGGREGNVLFVMLVLCLSEGLLILDRGAKIPEKT